MATPSLTRSRQKKDSRAINQLDQSRGADSPQPVEIKFYRASEKPYGVFSNLFPRSVAFEGEIFPTAEHAYQAGKARKKEVRDWILSAPTPSLVAMAAHGLYTWDIVPNWAQIKVERMRKVLRAKFSQNRDLAELLVSTGKSRIVESGKVNNRVNRTWGEVNGRGNNMLGVLLMEIREELRTGKDLKPPPRAPRLAETYRQNGTQPARKRLSKRA